MLPIIRRLILVYDMKRRLWPWVRRTGDVTTHLALRQNESLPILQAWHEWLIAQRMKTAAVSGGSDHPIAYGKKRAPTKMVCLRQVDYNFAFQRDAHYFIDNIS
jgi:hypothetical protein